jgi:hypothetical protein
MAYRYRGDQGLTASELLAMERAKDTAVRPAHRLENAEFLLRAGCTVEDALARAGYSHIESFKRAAKRQGRQDLIEAVTERLAA